MKKQKLMVQRMAKNVSLMRQDLRSDYPMNYLAEKELSTLVKKVSPQLYGMLVQQLLAFHADMQLEMAEDLVMFTYQNVAHTTGCPSVDMVLDVCYSWIASEQGILKPGFRQLINNVRV